MKTNIKTYIQKILDKYLLLVEYFIAKIISFNDFGISKEDLEEYYSKNKQYGRLKTFLIPTRVFSEIIKKKDINEFPNYMDFLVKRSLYSTLVIVILFSIADTIIKYNKIFLRVGDNNVDIYYENFLHLLTSWNWIWLFFSYFVIFLMILWSVSRILEIFLAFYKDAYTHLEKNDSKIIPYSQRVKLALFSYFELIVLFGVLYYSLSSVQWFSMFKEHLSMIDAIYFSGVTITTLGYGDILPLNFITKFLAIFEVICGFTLVIVSFTIYTSRAINEIEKKGT